MATIGKLALMLVADPAGITSGLAQAEKSITRFASAAPKMLQQNFRSIGGLIGNPVQGFLGPIQQMLSSIPLLGAAFASLPISAAGFEGFLKEGMAHVKEMAMLSDRLGISTESLSGLMLMSSGNSEAMVHGLQHLSRELGQAAGGSKEAAEKFKALGLNGAQMARLPLAEAWGKMADKIRELPTPAGKAAAAFALMGRQGQSVLPEILKGSEGMEKASVLADKMGRSFSRVQAQTVIDAGKSLQKLNGYVEGLKTQLAVQLSPLIIAAMDKFNEFSLSGINAGEAVASAIEAVASTVGLAIDAVQSFVDKLNELKGAANVTSAWIWENLTGLGKKGMTDDAIGEAAKNLMAMQEAADKRGSAFDKVHKFFDDLHAKADAAAKAIKGAANEINQVASNKVLDEVATPYEKFLERAEQLQGLALSPDALSRGMGAAFGSLAGSAGLGQPKLPGAAEAGSKEAYSTLARFESGQQARDPAAILLQLAELNKQQIAEQKTQGDLTRKALEGNKLQPVNIPY